MVDFSMFIGLNLLFYIQCYWYEFLIKLENNLIYYIILKYNNKYYYSQDWFKIKTNIDLAHTREINNKKL